MFSVALALTLAATPLERYGVRGWSIDDGLPQSSVTAIAQDGEGWLHLGTFGGLARFDGQGFEVFGASDGEGWSTVRITALVVGDDGTRWLGLQSGDVVRIDSVGAGHDRQLDPAPGIRGQPIWSMAEIDGVLWVAGSGGTARWDGAWTPIADAGEMRAVVQHGGVVWLGGLGGLYSVDGDIAVPSTQSTGALYALASTGDRLLMVGERGVTALVDGQMHVIDVEPGHEIVAGSDGTTYVGSGGRVRILGESGEVRLGSRIRDLFIDREQVLWVGTDGDGLRRLMREEWWLLEFDGSTLPLLEIEGGALLVGHGCELGRVVRVEPDGATRGVIDGCVRSLARGRGAEVWMGIDSTVARLLPDESVETIVDVGHNVLVVQPIGDDVYIGTESGGALRLRGGRLEPLPVDDIRVLAIEPGAAGQVWIGGQDGLTLLEGRETTRWTRRDGAPAGEIRALRVDADGTVFVGSYGGGLGVLRDGVFHRLTRRDGLTEDVISAILDDGRGALWLHGNRGLSRLMRVELEAWLVDPQRGVTVRRWATPEGNGGAQPAGIVMRDGSLALSTLEGVVRIDPRALPRLDTVPSLSVLRADVDGIVLSTTAEAEIPAGPGHVELEFTAAILRHPELARFEYRVISELDAASSPPWQRVGDERHLRWAGFLPGRYRIELRVTNESGVVSPTTTLDFVLAQPWHGRWIVRFAIALAIVLLVGGALGWRANLARAHLLGLQREIDQRLAAEAEARVLVHRLDEAERLETVGRLAGGIAHDFNNLFAAIRGATSMLGPARDGNAPVDIAAPVRTLEACVDRGARLTGQLLSFAGRQHLDADAFDLGARIIQMRPMVRGSLPESITLRLEVPRTPLFVLADAAALELAVASLVLNARDAVPAGGSVTISLRELDDDAARSRWSDLPAQAGDGSGWLALEIEDDGIGIPADRLGKVLEPFYSTRSNATGLGLPSVLGFATQSGGALRLASTEGKGTCVSLVLPRAEAPAAAPRVPRLVVAAAPPATPGRRIVVVDDDEQVREALTMMLRRAGHHVTAFGDPREALAQLEGALACELLISDIIMPAMTGGELATAVLAARPGMPMLFVSGFTRDVDAAALPGPLLAKPFGSAQVLAAVDLALAGGTGTRQRPA